MLHLEYVVSDNNKGYVDIQPANSSEIPGLRDMVYRNLLVENPALTFTDRMKGGWYEGWSDDELTVEATKACDLSDLWDNEPSMNVMMLLSKTLEAMLSK